MTLLGVILLSNTYNMRRTADRISPGFVAYVKMFAKKDGRSCSIVSMTTSYILSWPLVEERGWNALANIFCCISTELQMWAGLGKGRLECLSSGVLPQRKWNTRGYLYPQKCVFNKSMITAMLWATGTAQWVWWCLPEGNTHQRGFDYSREHVVQYYSTRRMSNWQTDCKYLKAFKEQTVPLDIYTP